MTSQELFLAAARNLSDRLLVSHCYHHQQTAPKGWVQSLDFEIVWRRRLDAEHAHKLIWC